MKEKIKNKETKEYVYKLKGKFVTARRLFLANRRRSNVKYLRQKDSLIRKQYTNFIDFIFIWKISALIQQIKVINKKDKKKCT